MVRNRFKLFIFVVLSFHLTFCVNYVDSFYTQRQRYASRMLKITPRECTSPQFPDLTGICMISMECHQRGGTVIGACRDGHLFGACCNDLAPTSSMKPEEPSPSTTTLGTTSTTTKLTTTTTMPTTTPSTTSTTTTTTSTTTTEEPPIIINNDISSDASLEADSTAIPSLIDTFSELSPTFLSELALDEHTTGIYTHGEDLLRVDMDGNGNKNRNEVSDEDSDNSAPNSASTEGLVATNSMMTSGSPSSLPVSSSSASLLSTQVQDEIGGLAGFGQDPDFKDNMIKYIDEIVTMRSNNEVTPPFGDDIPTNIINDSPDFNEIPFSTFTIVSSTKATESSSPVMWSWSTSGSSNNELSTTTQNPTTSTTETTTITSPTTPPSRPPPSFSSTAFTSASTEKSSPSEEILSVSVSQSSNDEVTQDLSSVIPASSSEAPTQFTFSKLKYTPRPYKPRSTTEKVVWTRPAATTPFGDKPLVNFDPEEDDASLEDDVGHDVLLTSPSTSSTTEAVSTEMMMTTSTETSPSPYPYIPLETGYANLDNDDTVDHNDDTMDHNDGRVDDDDDGRVDDIDDAEDDDIQGHYFGEVTSTTEDDPNVYYSPSSSTSDPMFSMSTTGLDGIDWTSPTILSYLKGVSESFDNLYYGNGSRSDFNAIPTAAANEITSPSSIGSTGGSSSSTWTPAYTTGAEMDNTISTSPSGLTTGFSSPSGPTTGFSSPSTGYSSYSSSISPSPSAPSSSLWDTSIDSFVDQVVEGIVHDLNKSNKIDERIFNNNNNNNKKGSGSEKKKVVSTGTTAAAATTSKTTKISSSTPASAVKFTTLKNKLKSALKKSKLKTTSKRPLITSTSSESPIKSTTSKEKLKVKVKVPVGAAKTRITKNKAKPVKKVTTVKSPNSTRKRLNYKRDCGVRPLMKRGRIVGGTPSRFGSWPWHALVKETVWWGIFSKIKCGGVLIGPQHVLTAAHCQPQQTGTLSVVLGITDSDDTDSRAITKTVRRTIPHPQFNPRTYENDIAILELDSPVDFQPHIVPICLPRDEDELEGKTAYVTGMGLLKHDGERPLVLQEVDLPILNNTECQKMFRRSGNKKPIIESFICAGYEQGRKDSCGGDSGGPLSVKRSNGQWVLAGTVSHGIKCALPDQPGVYMRTSYYKPWIDRVLSVARSRYRGIPRCNAPPLICARQRHHQHQLRQQQGNSETGIVNTLFRIFRLARKMVEEGRASG